MQEIDIQKLLRTPRYFTIENKEPWLSLAEDVTERHVIELQGEIELKAKNKATAVLATVKGHLKVDGTCDRCGEPCEHTVSLDSEHLYRNEEELRNIDEAETYLNPEDLEIGWYQGNTIDINSVFVEVLSLASLNLWSCEDQIACDARVKNLMPEPEQDKGPSQSPFSILKDL